MTKIRSDLMLFMERVLKDAGIKAYQFKNTNGGHRKVVFEVREKKHTVFFSSSTSDHRAVENQRAFMRRKLRALGAM